MPGPIENILAPAVGLPGTTFSRTNSPASMALSFQEHCGLHLCAGGLLEQQTGLNPMEIMTDTAGASDMVFGLFWLLGYQFFTAPG